MLLRNPKIRFAGYRKPHPLENKVEIKVNINLKQKFSKDSNEWGNNTSQRTERRTKKYNGGFGFMFKKIRGK